MYMFGVAQSFKECDLHKNAVFAGSSAGSLVSVALAVDADILKVRDFILEAAEDCRANPLSKSFSLRDYVLDCFEKNCPENGHQIVRGRVETAVTTLPYFRAIRYTNYTDREHLKKVVLASCCATPIAGFPFVLDGELVFDGGASDFQPLVKGYENQTITINPFFMSRADIKPSEYVPPQWGVYPPSRDKLEWLFNLGRKDGFHWIVENEHVHGYKGWAARGGVKHSKKEMMQQAVYSAGMTMSKLLVMLVCLLLRPFALFLLYVELWALTITHTILGVFNVVFPSFTTSLAKLSPPFLSPSRKASTRKSVQEEEEHHIGHFSHALAIIRSLVSPTVLYLYFSEFGHAHRGMTQKTHNRFIILFHQSFVFRSFVHAL